MLRRAKLFTSIMLFAFNILTNVHGDHQKIASTCFNQVACFAHQRFAKGSVFNCVQLICLISKGTLQASLRTKKTLKPKNSTFRKTNVKDSD